jgi:hypothetical protein
MQGLDASFVAERLREVVADEPKAFAYDIGVSLSAVYNYLNGRIPTTEVLFRIAAAATPGGRWNGSSSPRWRQLRSSGAWAMAATACARLRRRGGAWGVVRERLKGRCEMFWYPYTGSIPMAVSWSAGLFTTAMAIAALLGALRVVALAWRGAASDAVTEPFEAIALDDVEAVKQAAA